MHNLPTNPIRESPVFATSKLSWAAEPPYAKKKTLYVQESLQRGTVIQMVLIHSNTFFSSRVSIKQDKKTADLSSCILAHNSLDLPVIWA